MTQECRWVQLSVTASVGTLQQLVVQSCYGVVVASDFTSGQHQFTVILTRNFVSLTFGQVRLDFV